MHTPLVARARELAERAHEGQLRKSGGAPYFSHLQAVVEMLGQHGLRDEVTLSAAYLHDLLEDRPQFAEEFRASFPPLVVDTVTCLTEVKRDESGALRSKPERFDDYVAGLRRDSDAARRAIPISCADKIHNVSSIVEAERGGDSLLLRLRTRPGQHGPQLSVLRELYAPVVPTSLLAAFDQASESLASTIEAWLPGRAVHLAADAHLNQFDKAGRPYIYHPLHLAMQAQDEIEAMIAVLHDVIEDSEWDLAGLELEGFPPRVLDALDCLTRRSSETYDEFIERIALNPLARRVKLLDLSHNADLSRLEAPSARDRARVAKYRRAIDRLRAAEA